MEEKKQKKPFALHDGSKDFAIRSIKLYQYLTNEQSESMLNDCLTLVKILYVLAHPEARKAKKEGGAERNTRITC